MMLPQQYRQKIWNKVLIPYKVVYTLDMENIIKMHGGHMNAFYNNKTNHGKECYIAHGGGVGEFHYKNCREGLLDALEKGFQFIEIDFLKTVDGHLVGGHSWFDLAQLVGLPEEEVRNMPLSELKKLRISGRYAVLSGVDVKSIMEECDHMILVTDKINDYKLLLEEIPLPERMLVETVGGMYDYKVAIEAGVRYPIFPASDIEIVEKYGFPIVILNGGWLVSSQDNASRIKALHEKGITVLTWNSAVCDQPEYISRHLGNGVSLIYTDTWYPNGNSPTALFGSRELMTP